MTLYSDAEDIYSHMVRIVLAEKGVAADIIHIDKDKPPTELLDVNPYISVPTLLDRDLTLYEAGIILEYLDERFPHPPLLPVYPTARAKFRLMMSRIEKDLVSSIEAIEKENKALLQKKNDSFKKESKTAEKKDKDKDREQPGKACAELREHLISIAPLFKDKPYFLSEEFSLVDCYLGSILWRLPKLGIKLPNQASAIKEYAERIFARTSFQTSLSTAEREMASLGSK